MWELLQKLEDLGWKPYGKSIAELTETEKNVRLLTSLSSGLWQFVCENGMVRLHTKHQIIIQEDDIITTYRPDFIFHDDEYYIIQSALKDESELEDFLLQNIKIDG